MKKIKVGMVGICILVLALSGCGQKKETSSGSKPFDEKKFKAQVLDSYEKKAVLEFEADFTAGHYPGGSSNIKLEGVLDSGALEGSGLVSDGSSPPYENNYAFSIKEGITHVNKDRTKLSESEQVASDFSWPATIDSGKFKYINLSESQAQLIYEEAPKNKAKKPEGYNSTFRSCAFTVDKKTGVIEIVEIKSVSASTQGEVSENILSQYKNGDVNHLLDLFRPYPDKYPTVGFSESNIKMTRSIDALPEIAKLKETVMENYHSKAILKTTLEGSTMSIGKTAWKDRLKGTLDRGVVSLIGSSEHSGFDEIYDINETLDLNHIGEAPFYGRAKDVYYFIGQTDPESLEIKNNLDGTSTLSKTIVLANEPTTSAPTEYRSEYSELEIIVNNKTGEIKGLTYYIFGFEFKEPLDENIIKNFVKGDEDRVYQSLTEAMSSDLSMAEMAFTYKYMVGMNK